MRQIINIFLLVAAAAPFVMPPNAVVEGVSAEGGWRQCGEMPFSYRQTQAQFGAKFSAAGWRHKHSVVISKDRVVESWERGDETLTFMVWGQAPDKTGFSWGVSPRATAAGRDARPARPRSREPRGSTEYSVKNKKEKE